MAFKQKTWKDRLVEFAGRRTLNRISGSADTQMVVDITRSEGTVSQEGDAFSAANMNDLEQRVADEFASLNSSLGGFTPVIDDTGKITGYKTKAGADTVFPFSNLKGELLWENSKPDSSFGSQSISVPNLNKYNSFKIAYKPKLGLGKAYAITQTDGMLYPMCQLVLGHSDQSSSTNANNSHIRIMGVKKDNNRIYFTNALNISSLSGATNSYCVPTEIYGIEGSLIPD